MIKTISLHRSLFLLLRLGIVLLLVCTIHPGYSQIGFSAYKTTATGSAPTVVCIGDINNDGRNDVVLCTGYGMDIDSSVDNKTFVFIQNASNTLNPAITYSNSNLTPFAITICDVNNDNLNDVVIGFDDSVGIFYQNKQGTLNALKSYYSGSLDQIDGLSTGDLNGDGLVDIALSHYGSTVITVLYQSISGGFTSATFTIPVVSSNHVIEVADITNDKRDDIIVSMSEGIYVYTQSTKGTINPYVLVANGNTSIQSSGLAVGDLNNDGIKDVIQSISGNATKASLQMYFQDKTTHTLQPPMPLNSLEFPEPIRIADLNCDKKNEIIVVNGGSQQVSIYEQNNNSYKNYISFPIGDALNYNPYGLSVGDINNDGKNDIAIADYKNGLITLLNTSTDAGICCTKVIKPQQPVGTTAICTNGLTTKYTAVHTLTDSLYWNLYPAIAGTIIYASNDSCEIQWNDSWYGKASITVKAYNACGSNTSNPLYITVHQPPLDLGNDTTICYGYTLPLHAGSEFDSYLWKDTSIDSFLLAKSPLITFVKATNACGTAYDTITIKAFQSQAINLVSDSILCKGKSIVFNINIQGKNSYLWQDGTTSPQYTINQPGIYSITVTDTNSCQRSASVKITNLANPSISLPNDTIACNAISLPLQIQCAGCNYNWSNGATSATITADKEGTYSVTASNVCGNTKDSIHVGIDISPKIKTIGDTTICKGTSIVYSIGLEGNYSYHWQDASTDSLYTISKAGTYSFTVTDPHHCSSNKLFNITENIAPKFQLPNDSSYCDSIQIPLDVSCNACLYSWNDGFTLPHYVISKAGTYIVTVSNSCGTKSDSIIVHKIDCESMLDVPSAFSPNNDNINDVLYAVGKSIEHVSFKIFNRWGQLVFESNSMSNGWDGKQNGKAAEEGVYVYYISATSIKDGHTLTQTGTITLIR